MPTTELDRLRSAVRGRVWLPQDADYATVHRPWNLAVAQSPAAVVDPLDTADVSALVTFAASAGVPLAVQPSGHGATGRASGAILVRMSQLAGIEVHPERRVARIGAGVQSGALQRAAAVHGLTGLPGSSPVVSVTGAALGGGLSWFGRTHGWIADSVTAVDLVDATGKARRVSRSEDPDLFWAMGGGGGDIAIVTGLEIALHEAPSLFGGRMLWPRARAREVITAFREITADAPRELTAWLQLLQFPGSDPMIAIDTTFLGDEVTARRLLHDADLVGGTIADTRGLLSVADIGSITAEPTDPAPGRSRAELLTRLDDDAADVLASHSTSPLLVVQIRQLGGALTEPTDNPHGPLVEPFAAYLFGVPATAEIDGAITARQRELAGALPTSGRKPMTFLTPSESLADALPAASLERLRRIKDDCDPGDAIRGNFGVR
ncbi:FAD-binding oxidoreductase [Ruania halotolerans]|uniref:FAD-binding oxidoreductase n=1 Tax=Ruania halotolerans TaxID=2897773 RepID=UPI001E2A4C9B|nr:FAD-dependent oxidoreductase [Ruania halotolerans]UFU06864.1 FAD-dependent oxidoreductase [Ruania halotolerans]